MIIYSLCHKNSNLHGGGGGGGGGGVNNKQNYHLRGFTCTTVHISTSQCNVNIVTRLCYANLNILLIDSTKVTVFYRLTGSEFSDYTILNKVANVKRHLSLYQGNVGWL